jgi:hypothetical protein
VAWKRPTKISDGVKKAKGFDRRGANLAFRYMNKRNGHPMKIVE